MRNTPQIEDIIDIINNNFKEFKGSNEAILHAAEEIIELFTPKVEPESKSLSAMQFIKRNYPLNPTFSTEATANIAESFASMREEQAEQKWKEEKAIILNSFEPWSTVDILNKLIEASNILMHQKDYDGHGWEDIEHCINHAKSLVVTIESLNNEK